MAAGQAVRSHTHFKVCKDTYKLVIEVTPGWGRNSNFQFLIFLIYILLYFFFQNLLDTFTFFFKFKRTMHIIWEWGLLIHSQTPDFYSVNKQKRIV